MDSKSVGGLEIMDGKYSIEESLRTLEIDYDDITQVSDGSYGYLFLLVSNLNEKDKKLLRELEFIDMYDDLWCKVGEDLQDIPKSRLIDIIENLCGKESRQRESIYTESNKELWQSIVSKYCNIMKIQMFEVTPQDIETACDFNGFLCTDKMQFNYFVTRMNEFLKHIVLLNEFKEITSPLKKYKDIRDYIVHDLGKDPDGEEKYLGTQNIVRSIIGKPFPICRYDYMSLQNKILKDCDDTLNEIINFLNRSPK